MNRARKFSVYENRKQRLASRKVFSQRLTHHGLIALATITVALVIGMAGYMYFDGMDFVSAFESAAMILSGMGPVNAPSPEPTGGKIFAGFYALFSGLLIFGVAGLILAPVLHRLLHSFHVDDTDGKK
jgi:predicted PurR-regulated permease PerM